MTFDPLNMSDKDIADIKKQANRDKAKRAKRNRSKPKSKPESGASSISAPGSVGSAISGSGSAKVRASKSRLPQQNRHERLVSNLPAADDYDMPLGDPKSSSDHFLKGFHEERTEDPHPHPILGAYNKD